MSNNVGKPSFVLSTLIGVVAVGGVAWSAYLIGQADWDDGQVAAAALLAALVLLAGLFPIPVAPRVKAGMTTAPLFAAALVLSPGGAVLAAMGGGLVYQGALRFRSPQVRVPWYQLVFNLGETALSTGTAAYIFDRVAEGDLTSAAVLAAVVAMYLINSGLVALGASTQLHVDPLRFWWTGTKESIPPELSLFAFGYLGALAYQANELAIMAVLLPVFIVYHAFSRLISTNSRLEEALARVQTLQGQVLQNAKLATLGSLTLDLAHQLKNPLFIVTGRLENLMWKIPKDDPVASEMDEALQAAWRTNQLIEAFLNEAQQRWVPLDVVSVLNEAVTTALTKINKSITIQRDFPEDEVLTEGIPTLMREALTNLVTNAVEAVADDGTVVVSIERDEHGCVSIGIQDDGPGISAQQMPHVFEPFWTSKEGGTGIGLFSAKHIVELHQGQLNVVSPEGAGTRVQVFLPATGFQGGHSDSPTL